jgi:hypothetical protein
VHRFGRDLQNQHNGIALEQDGDNCEQRSQDVEPGANDIGHYIGCLFIQIKKYLSYFCYIYLFDVIVIGRRVVEGEFSLF